MYKSKSITTKAFSLLPSFFIFNEWYKFLKKSQFFSRKQHETFQLKRLIDLLNHAYEHVPYYRRVFNEHGLKPADIKQLQDLQKLPFLTKELIRKNIDDLKATNIPSKKFEYVTTSGTTSGSMGPLGFYYEKGASRAIEWAFMKTQWDRVGYKFSDKCVVIRGYGTQSNKKDRFYEYSFFRRWLLLSPFHMNEKNFSKYIDIIRTFNPKYIQAFPSEIVLLAKYMKLNEIKPFPNLKALLLGSENLYAAQRELLEEVFQCPVYSWYGHAEQAVLAGECEKNEMYHIFPEYGIMELIDKSGSVITNDDTVGEIVATGLNNYVMPLIRYKTQDLAKLSSKRCSCGRHYPMITQLEGRIQEMIIGKDEGMISLTAILAAIKRLEGYPQLNKVQFVQEEKGKLLIKIVKGETFTSYDEQEIVQSMEKTFGDVLTVDIEYVDEIPPTKIGKHRFLIQKLPVNFGKNHNNVWNKDDGNIL